MCSVLYIIRMCVYLCVRIYIYKATSHTIEFRINETRKQQQTEEREKKNNIHYAQSVHGTHIHFIR